MNAKQTASAMHVHVNTIYYRLERLAQATGIDPYSVTDVVGLVIANRLRGHLGPEGDALDDSTKGR
jgi:sugar diacid utilization regulator